MGVCPLFTTFNVYVTSSPNLAFSVATENSRERSGNSVDVLEVWVGDNVGLGVGVESSTGEGVGEGDTSVPASGVKEGIAVASGVTGSKTVGVGMGVPSCKGALPSADKLAVNPLILSELPAGADEELVRPAFDNVDAATAVGISALNSIAAINDARIAISVLGLNANMIPPILCRPRLVFDYVWLSFLLRYL